MTDDQRVKFRDIAERLLRRELLRVSWSTCRYQQLGILPSKSMTEPDLIEKAAADLKAAGIEWEEYT